MTKLITAFFLLVLIQPVSGQQPNWDSIVQKISDEKDDNKKVIIVTDSYTPEINNNPAFVIEAGLKLLKQGQLDQSLVEESSAYSFLGQGYRLLGSYIKGLEYHHKAISLAEKSGNLALLAVAENQIGHIYKDRQEFDKAIQFYQSSLANAEKGSIERIRSWPMLNLAGIYLSQDKLDSALKYAQRGYEIDLKFDGPGLVLAYMNLGGVHSKSGNAQLAISYFNLALNTAPYTRYRNLIYTGIAEHYRRVNQTDSCELYARKAIAAVEKTPFYYLSSTPALLLTEIYEKTNCDSTLKYAKIVKVAGDSLNSTKANQQIQLMTFEEDVRKQEAAAERIKAAEDRQQNIQYALIAFGIILLLTLYLLLSRSFITNARVIQFFGVVALLIVFEFLNLLLHPFLERVTHHSPILMLLGLVCIAALLVPIHHKFEKWLTVRLVEKNKRIRLAAAKKTIEQLDN